ncbi:Glutathione S-transferase U1 [Ascosphaera atra]|nr:Glutathione S-transferase U1 [Ascosphaera atra]
MFDPSSPFVQRVWITLELKGIPYQYIEIDAYKKPKELLDVNPRGLVPALRHGDWGCYESTVLLDYLEDISPNHPLLPGDAKLRAHSRLWGDHVNRHIVPTFYKLLVDQNKEARPEHEKNLKQQFELLVKEASKDGPFFLDEKPTWVDVQIAPWILRLKLVLKPYRNWPDPENLQLGNGLTERWTQWVHAIEEDEAIKRTTSDTVLYLESYERYAENRPNTSKLADAINSGSALP